MNMLRPLAHFATACTRTIVRAITAGFDALTGPVGRLNDRVEAHLRDRTSLLRAYYARPVNRQAAPLPVLDGPVDLALRGGTRETGAARPSSATPAPSSAMA
jgi:hypothetical protein